MELQQELIDTINRHLPGHLWLSEGGYIHHLDYVHDPGTGHSLPHIIGEIIYRAQEDRLFFSSVSQPLRLSLQAFMAEVSPNIETFLSDLAEIV